MKEEIQKQIANAVALIGDEQVLNQFFDGAQKLIQELGIGPDDKRLAFTSPQKERDLRINMNGRLVFAVMPFDNGEEWMFMIKREDFDRLEQPYHLLKGMDFSGKDNMVDARGDSTELPIGAWQNLFDLCKSACSEYLPTQSGSRFRNNHLPQLYEMAINKEYRQNVFKEILEGEKESPQQMLIRKYVARVKVDGNKEELYKWNLLGKKYWDLDAPDMLKMVKSIPFGNLVYPMGMVVLHRLASLFPEELRALLKMLFDDGIPLQERLSKFRAETLILYRRDEKRLAHHQDERSMASFLAFYDGEKYPLYKRSFYKKYCDLLSIKAASSGSRYTHYISLLKDFIETWLLPDAETVDFLKSLSPEGSFADNNLLLLGQDILYTTLDYADTTSAEDEEEANEDETTEINTTMPQFPLNQILYGPPGTGKTYHTVNTAVAIVNPNFNIAGKNRMELIDEFNRLRDNGQIEFITFHQSLSYEDFIEGIKPDEPEPDDEFLSYHIQNGLFKEFALRASAKANTDFERAFTALQEELVARNNEQLTLKTPTGKEFGITLNRRGNLSFYTGKREKQQGVFTKEGLQRQLGTGDYYKWWLSYYTGIMSHMKAKYGFNEAGSALVKSYVLIIDEINRGNVSQIFGELITLIEDGKRAGQPEALSATLPYSREYFSVPPNLYIIGTMNTADRSVEALDTALRRRFTFEEIAPQPGLLSEDVEGINLKQLLSTINERLEVLIDRDHTIGHAWLMGSNTAQEVAQKFKTTILPLLREYFYNDYSKIGLVLGDAFVKQKNSKSTAKPFATFVAINSGIRKELAERPLFEVSVPADDDTTALVAAFRSVYQQAQPDSSNGNERL